MPLPFQFFFFLLFVANASKCNDLGFITTRIVNFLLLKLYRKIIQAQPFLKTKDSEVLVASGPKTFMNSRAVS